MDTPSDYVIGTGVTHSIQDFCEVAFRHVGLDWTDHVRVDPKLSRKIDSHYTRADPSRIKQEVGWSPKAQFTDVFQMMVNAQPDAIRTAGKSHVTS